MGHAVEEAAGRKVGRAGSPCVVKASEGQDATKKGGLDRQDRAMKLCAVTRRPVARLAGKASPVRHGNNIGLDARPEAHCSCCSAGTADSEQSRIWQPAEPSCDTTPWRHVQGRTRSEKARGLSRAWQIERYKPLCPEPDIVRGADDSLRFVTTQPDTQHTRKEPSNGRLFIRAGL